MGENMENYAEFIFADHQFLFIFADSGEFRKNFFRKQFLPLTYLNLKDFNNRKKADIITCVENYNNNDS